MHFENPPNQNKKEYYFGNIILEIFQSKITNSYLIFLFIPCFGIHSTSQGDRKKDEKIDFPQVFLSLKEDSTVVFCGMH